MRKASLALARIRRLRNSFRIPLHESPFSGLVVALFPLLLAYLPAAKAATPDGPVLQRPAIQSDGGEQQEQDETSDPADESATKADQGLADLIKAHKEDPAKSLKNAPVMGKTRVHGHINWMKQAADAGKLYSKTKNEDDAQFAADRLNHYVQFLGAADGVEAVVSSDGAQRDYRDVHKQIAFTYDSIQPFLIKAGTTVFDDRTGKRIPFDSDKAQRMFRNIVEYGFRDVKGGSNITVMETTGIVYPALCIEDKNQRDAYVKTCVEGWGGYTGVRWMKNVLIKNNGIWPESATYSGVGRLIPGMMAAVDHLYPEYKMFSGFQEALNGVSDRLLFSYPNGVELVAFGDSRRRGQPWQIPGWYARIAQQAGFNDVAKRLSGESKSFENHTVHLPYAGIIIQNNVDVPDPKLNGLMYYSGGANYTHSHQSGLDLELYGAGVVLGGVGSELGAVQDRGSEIYTDYYRIYAGHNTVIVNGKSAGANKGWKGYYSGWMDPVKLQAAEPMPHTPPVSKNFTFSSQILDDTVNKAEQQRIVSIVRTSDTTGYYLDLFRSRSNGKNEFHDYIYHNIGDGLTLTSASGKALPLSPAEDRYQTCVMGSGERRAIPFPGWKSFSKVATSPPTADAVAGTFDVDLKSNRHAEPNIPPGKRYMHVAMPGGNEREYTSAEAPPILESAGGYDKKNARMLTIRQPGEAWDRPFLVIFEPSLNEKPTVQSVENIWNNQKQVVGAKVVSQVGDTLITDWIIAQENDKATLDDQASHIEFHGRFAIVRTVKTGEETALSLYIGDGSQLSFGAYRLSPPAGQTAAFKTF